MSLSISIEVDAGPHAPGDRVTGSVAVTGGGRSRSLTTSLVYREWTEDFSYDARTVSETMLATGPVADGARYPFELALPGDALPNIDTAHGGLRWEVVTHADVPGLDALERQQIDVRTPDRH